MTAVLASRRSPAAAVPARTLVVWLGLFAALALAFSWPLPLRLDTHLTGAPSGDTGVSYVAADNLASQEIKALLNPSCADPPA